MNARIKYPRTYHLPWSQGATSDDKVLKNTSIFKDKEVVITEKMDGENTTIYSDSFHARSIDSGKHSSRDWVSAFQSQIGFNIPNGWRVCGENLFAKHSIEYTNLTSFFLGFSIWNDNICLSWDETIEYFNLIGIQSVPVLWRGIYSDKEVISLCNDLDLNTKEGIVVRVVDSFLYEDFKNSVAKFVRKNHVSTNTHWTQNEIIQNKLAQ
jgi:hypothetical protein